MRELTLVGVAHPEFLEEGQYLLVDHPITAPLTEGDPTLGWEGDSRLAIYLHLENKNFVLFRLEHDNEYRAVARLPEGRVLDQQQMNLLIKRLVEHDVRRGFDPYQEIVKTQEAIEKDLRRNQHDQNIELGDKLHWAFAHSYVPGFDICRPRQVPKKV